MYTLWLVEGGRVFLFLQFWQITLIPLIFFTSVLMEELKRDTWNGKVLSPHLSDIFACFHISLTVYIQLFSFRAASVCLINSVVSCQFSASVPRVGRELYRCRMDPLCFLAGWRKRRLNQALSCIGVVRLCLCASFVSQYYVCVHVYVGSILLCFGFFVVDVIDFAVGFCCPYQCK